MENPRAKFLQGDVSSSSGNWQYQRRYQRKKNYNKPQELPTHSISRSFTPPEIVVKKTEKVKETILTPKLKVATDEFRSQPNNRFALYSEKIPEYKPDKKPFIGFCTEKQYIDGWRPGWMCGINNNMPDKYTDAVKMYNIYKQTGKIVSPYSGKKSVDKVRCAANAYQYKNTSKKK